MCAQVMYFRGLSALFQSIATVLNTYTFQRDLTTDLYSFISTLLRKLKENRDYPDKIADDKLPHFGKYLASSNFIRRYFM